MIKSLIIISLFILAIPTNAIQSVSMGEEITFELLADEPKEFLFQGDNQNTDLTKVFQYSILATSSEPGDLLLLGLNYEKQARPTNLTQVLEKALERGLPLADTITHNSTLVEHFPKNKNESLEINYHIQPYEYNYNQPKLFLHDDDDPTMVKFILYSTADAFVKLEVAFEELLYSIQPIPIGILWILPIFLFPRLRINIHSRKKPHP